jgi:UDP-N-acetylmuramoylalanine--D-glutamate ligase
VEALRGAGVEVHLGEQGLELLGRVRAVVKSPGVPATAPVIVAARERGMPVLGELELAWRLIANEFIAVTGTNGKTTTVELIGHIHREASLPVAVAGNVGTAASSLVGRVDPEARIVCEASSFQLEDVVEFAPEAAVLLNIAPDHLDRHLTMEAYEAAKLEVFARQGPEDLAVAPCTVGQGRESAQAQAGGDPWVGLATGSARRVCFGAGAGAALSERTGELWWEGRALLAVCELPVPGRHNVENAMAAAAVCLARGIDPDAVRAGLRSFPGVPHRLEAVGRRDGVLYVNDSKATNVASTLVALDALLDSSQGAIAARATDRPAGTSLAGQSGAGGGRGPVHLILGGQGKGQDFGVLRGAVERSCRAVYLIGEDAPAIARALAGGHAQVRECGDLESALAAAGAWAAAGDVVLLSPACASFDQFEDFEDRGERFRELVRR